MGGCFFWLGHLRIALTQALGCHRPACPGDPVTTDRGYWIARSSRAMTLIEPIRKRARTCRRSGPLEHEKWPVERREAAVIGTGWCGGIRAETLARSALCRKLHICEIRPDRLAEVKALTNPASATLDYQDIVRNGDISVVYICTTPEHTHFPIPRDCLKAGKHVLLEKPIAMELFEAYQLIAIASRSNVKVRSGTLPAIDPHCGATSSEITGAEGSRCVDDTQRDNWLKTVAQGTQFPMSPMRGEQVDHVFAGQMGPETLHFLESVMLERPPLVSAESARRVMDCYLAADLTANCHDRSDVPMT